MHIPAVAITQVAKFGGKNLHGNIAGSGSLFRRKKRNEDNSDVRFGLERNRKESRSIQLSMLTDVDYQGCGTWQCL